MTHSRRIPLLVLAIVVGALGCQSAAPPTTHEDPQASVIGFGKRLTEFGLAWIDYWTYGCYCGWGNAGEDKTPIDATDSCCQTHDSCYDHAPAGCNCLTAGYDYYTEAGWIGCNNNGGNACAEYCCQCDAD